MTKYFVTADHPAKDWQLDNVEVKVSQSRHDGFYSASLPRFGYVCGFNSARDAIIDLTKANGCTNIRVERRD